MRVGYKTLSYSARLSSCSVKQQTFSNLIFLQPKFTRMFFWSLRIFPENLSSFHQELCELLIL